MSDVKSALAERLTAVRQRIAAACARVNRVPESVTLVAVTKTVTPEIAAMLMELGVIDLGENRPQELWRKQQAMPTARFHLIGHLQRNKLERTVPLCTLIHSVDSERLLTALSDHALKSTFNSPVLLEVNCSREPAKGGFAPDADLVAMIRNAPGVDVRGLMTMAAHHDDPALCRPAFAELRTLRDQLQDALGRPMPELSMGMSNDYEVAIEEGATLVRVGSALFESL
jgi:hypothetical protein